MDISWKAGWGQPPWCGVVIWKRFWILSCGKVVQKSCSGMSWKQLTIQVLLMVDWRQDKDVWCVHWGSFQLDSIVIITDFSTSIFLTTILYNALAHQFVLVAQGCELLLYHNKLLYILDLLTLDLKAVDYIFSAIHWVFLIDSQKFDEFSSDWGIKLCSQLCCWRLMLFFAAEVSVCNCWWGLRIMLRTTLDHNVTCTLQLLMIGGLRARSWCRRNSKHFIHLPTWNQIL